MKKLVFCMIAGIMSLIGCGTPEPTGELLSVDYTHSGTMAGYIYEGRVKQDSNGNYVLTAMKENYGPLFQKQISKEAVDSFKQIIIEEKMYKYKEHYTPRMNAWPRGNGLGRIQGYLLKLIADADTIVEESEEDKESYDR